MTVVASTNSNYFQVYLNACVALAQTMVIKSTESEQGLNQFVIDNYGAAAWDETDPTSWKYYMNLSGKYHFTDQMMYVISLDTMERIEFTPANLLIHTATAQAYQFGSTYYQALVDQYPRQVSLILGILYPVDQATAIAAKDGQILGWPAQYIEVNEYSLVEKLQAWIYGFKQRWINPQFGLSDELYFTVQLHHMYQGLLQAIIAYREEACRTAEMHSFHQQQFLASHQGLDQYMDQLSLNQIVWLCRNINYIQRNVGKRSTFQTLIQNILTVRNIPLAAYTMRHNTGHMPTLTSPEVFFQSDPLNFDENLVASTNWTLATMLDTEQPLATMNAQIQTDQAADIQLRMENALSNTLQTKVLNSAMVDETDSTPYTMEDILVNHWLLFSQQDLYTAFLVVNNPVTGEPIVPMNAKDGFVFMWYCYSRSIGIDLTNAVIPAVLAQRVVRTPLPNVTDLMSVVDWSLVSQDIATQMLGYMPAINPMISTTSFFATCKAIWTAANNQRGLVSRQEHYLRRGMVYGMSERCYQDVMIQLGDQSGETFYEWFHLRNIDLGNFSQNDWGLMYTSLVQAATGIDLLNTNSVANLQKAMIGIMEKLSSYSVQYLYEINNGAIQDIDWPMVRVGDIHTDAAMELYGEQVLDTYNERVSGVLGDEFDIGAATCEVLSVGASVRKDENICMSTWLGDNAMVFKMHTHQLVGVRSATPLQENSRGIIPVIGLDNWLAMDEAAQDTSLVSIYQSNWNNAPNAPVKQLASVWPVRNLSGLTYTPPN
jgi:hypothetical protein